MASKRLLDFVLLASATKQVIKHHARLRADQISIYSQTSSFTKPFRSRIYNAPQATAKPERQEPVEVNVNVNVKEERQKEAEEAKGRVQYTQSGDTRTDTISIAGTVKANVEEDRLDQEGILLNEVVVPPPRSPLAEQSSIQSTTSPKTPDSDLFLLRSARGSSSLLARIRKQKDQAQSTHGQDKDLPSVPPLRNRISIEDIPTPPLGSPDLAVPEEPPARPGKTATASVIDPPGTLPISKNQFPEPSILNSPTPDQAVTIPFIPSPTISKSSPDDTISTSRSLPNSATTPLTPSELDATIQSLTTDTLTSEQSHLSAQAATSPSGHKMTASRVPSSRFSRMMHYTGLGIGMTFGALSEGIKRVAVGNNSAGGEQPTSLMLNEANVERLVKKLSRMRGAALKLGQMLSFQDSKLLPPALHQILSRVQDAADYMPSSQLHPILISSLGPNWRSNFISFSETPIAAASIGQVHLGTLIPELIPLTDPRNPTHPDHDTLTEAQKQEPYEVAIKIQYPNIKESITSDLNNLSMLLTASRVLPKGLYLDKTIANARRELAWECDYVREADSLLKFHELLFPSNSSTASPFLNPSDNPFTLPTLIPALSTPNVLTLSFLTGKPITRIPDLTQSERDFLGTEILRLSLMEIAKFKFMQTDPNWSNFLYNRQAGKIELLDFGASREFDGEFVEVYLNLLRAGRKRDKEACRELSVKLGYLTGFESKAMIDAHVQSIFILAEPFRGSEDGGEVYGGEGDIYDFSTQTVTERVKSLIPLMLRERLTPPPEETYSLHRKLSGAFLLCARLGSKIECKRLWGEVVGF